MSATARRSTARREDDRAVIVAALEEATGPLRFDELLAAVTGSNRGTLRDEGRLGTDLRALQRAGTIVERWDVWTHVYRLATPQDLDEDEDRREVARLRAAWIPAELVDDRG